MLLVTGGQDNSYKLLASTEVCLSSRKQYVSVICLLQSMFSVLDRLKTNLNQVAVYSTGGFAWREVAGGELPSPRSYLRAAMVGDVLHVTGGAEFVDGVGNNYLTSILAWDPVAESWQDVGDLNVGRVSHAAVAVTDIITCPRIQ